MRIQQVGIIGWRGMVGSVLLDAHARGAGLRFGRAGVLQHLPGRRAGARRRPHGRARCRMRTTSPRWRDLPMLISTQGGDYTQAVHPRLRAAGWQGYWIDAASTLRMREERGHRARSGEPAGDAGGARAGGIKDFIGGNCTVSLMLMARRRPAARRTWSSGSTAMTYQSASGAGAAAHARAARTDGRGARRGRRRCSPIPRRRSSTSTARSTRRHARRRLPTAQFGVAAGGEPDPVDRQGSRQRPEPRGVEGAAPRPTRSSAARRGRCRSTGICVRVGAMRCHSQALTIKLRATCRSPRSRA